MQFGSRPGGPGIRIAKVLDGTSKTILLGEVHRIYSDTDPLGLNRNANSYRSVDGWALAGAPTVFGVAPAQFGGNARDNPAGGLNNLSVQSPGSEHPGGANFCMVDGSTHFVSENADEEVFGAFGSAAGGEFHDPSTGRIELASIEDLR
ncbi:hypothetical protein Pla175_36190 [Pirellulimonas nuda]|uniref:DUF1559 domain-containing protein n=1 Tax=Pirellulimonas nuda TaxID=2528009 RepID=A0A518DFG2_9BACT|nr:DUF1559 domain-containing protein [Pirellulimonas nuda]QDU90217.1 hypothetical protein Pla175_36190 [Pirellulimonas nuda]